MVSFVWPSGWVEGVLALIHIAIAGTVTAHALLRKYDSRAALGWIALAWLSPGAGALLYFLFGINRVERRAVRIGRLERQRAIPPGATATPPVSSNIATLAQIGGRIADGPLLPGNTVELLRGGREAFPAMLAAIDGAKKSVALASYIFRNDDTGSAFTAALIAAHKRGVAVRVLLDGIGSGYILPAPLRRMLAAGVPAERFLHTWVPWRMPFLNMRNHKKLLIVDGAHAFTGGLNIGSEYRLDPTCEKQKPGKVDDVHVRLEGPAVQQLMGTFARDWGFTTGEALDQSIWWPRLTEAGSVFARGIPSGPDADLYKLEALLGAALAQARRRVRIVTPYFLPDQRLQFALVQARLRGVEVTILIPGKCDFAFMDWAMRAHLQFLRNANIAFHFSPPPFDHAKLMTVDGQWSLIGSSNWDVRSLRLNFEFDLECYDADFTARLDALIDERLARSHALDPESLLARPKWMQLRDSAARLFLPYL
jgi:cardiolipin synthase